MIFQIIMKAGKPYCRLRNTLQFVYSSYLVPFFLFPDLNCDITVDDVERAKAHVKSSGMGTSTGFDNILYDKILELEGVPLCFLLRECVRLRDAPSLCLQSLLAGILKKNGDPFDARSYRAVALESCLLKFLTLIIHLKLSRVIEDAGILPDSQNGFLAGFQTNDNMFILRTCIERAFADSRNLHVAFVDVSDAFPPMVPTYRR